MLASLWPTAAILFGALVLVLVLCVRAPSYAFALALLLYSFEGTFKMRLSVEGAPSPVAVGAAALDFAFLVSVAALLLHDRGQSLLRVWNAATKLERLAGGLLAAWLALSLLQIVLGGDLVDALEGFRVTQFYVPAVLGGVILAARLGSDRLSVLLLGVIVLAVVYAAFRGLTGPTVNEQVFAERRAFNSTFGELGRNTGSFTGPVGLVSFLVPAALLCLVLAVLRPDRRPVLVALFGLAMIGIVASYVRTALVAVVVGSAFLAAMLIARGGASRRRGGYAVAVMAVVLVGGYGATLIAGEATTSTKERAESLADPFSDYSVTTRFDRWGDVLETVGEEPLGTGLGTVGRATTQGRRAVFTDNSYLKVLQEQGIPGGLLFVAGLGLLFVAAAIRLARRDPLRRPLGTAALAAFSGFLVLMMMGEYIEQPGKLLAWSLLGVALWEGLGRSDSDPEQDWPTWRSARERVASAASRVRRWPRPLVGLLLAAAILVIALPAVMRATSDSSYTSHTTLLRAPSGSNAAWERRVERLLDAPGIRVLAARGTSLQPTEVRSHLTTRFVRGPRLRYSVVATGDTPRQARRLASSTGQTLVAATYVERAVGLRDERRQLRRELRAGNQTAAARAATRQRLERVRILIGVVSLYSALPVESSKPEPETLLDTVANDLSGRTAPPPSGAWTALAALIFVLTLGAALLTGLLVHRASRRPSLGAF